jgi:undecaprenyl-diphosphatase
MSFPFLFAFTQLASTEGFLICVGLITAYVMIRHGIRHGLLFLATAFGLVLTVDLLKEFFAVPRPLHPRIAATGYALPSGHAAGAAYLAVVVAHLFRRARPFVRYSVWAAAGIAALAIGISRVNFEVHTPFQVIAGFALGVVFAWAFVLLDERRPHASHRARR